MTLSRAALVGPFQGPTLPVNLPLPIDKPDRLSQWEVGPRLEVCELELLSGLHFDVNQAKESVTVGFVNLDKKPLKNLGLVRLVRPSAKVFRQQLELVANYAELREDRGAEILAQMTPQVPFWGSIVGLQAHRHKWTLELIDLVLSLAVHVEMRFKHAFACQRPAELSPQVQSMIPSPGHGSWPSGHATEAFAVATVLQSLLQSANGTGAKYQEQLQRQASRIAVNRTVAGVHYPVDSAVGRLLGTALGDFFVARCIGNGKLHEYGFDGPKFHGAKDSPVDFDLRISMTDNKSGYYERLAASGAVAASPLLAFMWGKAAKEWEPLK
ncbi:MAG TPA: phosphatase PAP2 family protein [Burkholderiaceae bacterium]|nr:phosphatase PAP2 family protein [Burkholderiaceae bacterium]